MLNWWCVTQPVGFKTLIFGFKGHSTAQSVVLWLAACTPLIEQRGPSTQHGKMTRAKKVKVDYIGSMLQTETV